MRLRVSVVSGRSVGGTAVRVRGLVVKKIGVPEVV